MTAFRIADDDHPIVPVDGPWHISSRFDPHRMHPIKHVPQPHYGVDLGAPLGTPVVAYRRGVVELVWPNNPTAGNFVVLKHEDNTRSRYLDLHDIDPACVVGAHVARGQRIGSCGNPAGVSTGPHVHFETREPGVNGTGVAVDPVTVVPGLNPGLSA